MDGNIFFSNRFDPSSEAIAFNFDLQRFDAITITSKTEGDKTTYTYETGETATKYNSELEAAKAAGAVFYVTTTTGTGDQAVTTNTYYNSADDFKSNGENAALANANNITILGDITLSDNVAVDLGTSKDNKIKVVGTATLNLGANNLTISRSGAITDYGYPGSSDKNSVGEAYSAILVQDGANFTVKGTTGQIEYNWRPDKVKKARVSAAIQIGNDVGVYNTSKTSKATFNMESGNITSYSVSVSMSDNAVLNVNGGKITSTNSSGVYYGNDSPGGGTMNINGGTIETGADSLLPAIQVSGLIGNVGRAEYGSTPAKAAIINVTGGTIAHNGTESKEIVTDENGKVTSITDDCNPNAICASGNVKLTISGGTITSTGTAVEIRAGSLDITGGTIGSTTTKYFSENKSGGSSYGVGVAIAQHTTKQPININISGNTDISGPNALGVSNPARNIGNDNAKITATIDGGNLRSTSKSVSGDSTQGGNAILADKANVAITVNNGNLNGNVTVTKVKEIINGTPYDPDMYSNSSVVISGGTTTGVVQVLESERTVTQNTSGKDTSSTVTKAEEETTTDKTSLQVLGGKISDTTSANKYVATGSKVSSDGTVTESSDNKWSVVGGNNLHHSYVLVGSVPSLNASIVDVTIGSAADSVYLKYDETNKLLSVPYVTDANISLASAKEYRGRYLAQQTVVGSAASIKPWTEGVKITGTGFISNDINNLTIQNGTDSLATIGIYVDATDNRLAHIIGGKGKDSIKAGDRRTTLDGGDNDDVLDGGDGIDTFIYSAGNDVINNYEYGTDIASLNGVDAPIDFDAFTGSDFVFKFNDNNQLTFRSVAEVALTKGTDVYTYQGNTNGNMNYIAHKGNGISLGSGYSGRFNGTTAANDEYATINAERVGSAIRITGNDKANYIVASSMGGGLEGGEGDDKLYGFGVASSLTLNGGAGSDSLVGGTGYNLFVYNEGSDSISGYHAGDLVTVRGVNLEKADFSFTDNNIKLGFESNDDNLTFENAIENKVPISIQSGKNLYVYEKEKISHDKSVTLTSGYSNNSFEAVDNFDNINAVKASNSSGVSISGNDNNNVIFGSSLGGGLFGDKGNDTLNITDRRNDAKFVLKYTEGKDVVSGFKSDDKLDITEAGGIVKAKSSKGGTRLAFTFNTSKSDVLTFNSEDEIERVSLSGDNGFLTKDGVVSIGSDNSLKLFANAKGKIDLTDTLYSVDGGIASVSAADVAKQSVTLIGGTQGGQFTFAGNNKKKDQFEYNGGNVTISGYEAGKDRLNLNTAELSGFSVSSETNGDVSLGAGTNGIVVLKGMKGQEVLLHHADSKRNSFTKMVFKQEGVILNKEKRPTMATVYSGANYSAATEDTTVKKIFVADGADNISITAGDRNKTTLDASASNGGVTLTGGAKNDKLIGSTDAADTFIYTGGKDIIQNYNSDDQISLGSFKDNLLNSKISAGSRSIKFKFAGSSKNTLTIKPAKGSTLGDALNISDTPKYTYAKNAIISASNATLTSEFSGSYRLKNSGVNNVDGSLVKKNLTYRGTSADETLSGGTKKTTFKGGGGKDSLKGGSGNDIFFYAKGDSGNTTIADFDFTKDKLKIASGTITDISTVSGGIKFDMNNGKKNSANIGSFTIGNIADGYENGNAKANEKTAIIKANNTYYWFADENVTDSSGNVLAQAGELITADSKVSKSQVSDYAVIDLGYSSNLVKAGIATKAGEFNFTATGITKKTTNNG